MKKEPPYDYERAEKARAILYMDAAKKRHQDFMRNRTHEIEPDPKHCNDTAQRCVEGRLDKIH